MGVPFTDWDDVPLVCNLKTVCRVLNMSPRWVMEQLKAGTMQPQPMPRLAGGKWQWSKAVLQKYVEGGYRQMPVRGRRKKAA